MGPPQPNTHAQPRRDPFPRRLDYRHAVTRIKDACGAARGGRAIGPVLDPASRSHRTGSSAGKGHTGSFRHACKRLREYGTAGRTRLTPARSFRDVHWPGTSAGAVDLRSQTALTGSDRPRTIPAAGAGMPACTDETCCMSSGRFHPFAPADRRWRPRSGSGSGSGGVRAVAAARAARRAALKTVQKFLTRTLGGTLGGTLWGELVLRRLTCDSLPPGDLRQWTSM
jgi:hypothetical protein